MFGKKRSNDVAKERLKLVLIHDRYGSTPDGNMIRMIKRDIIRVISNYVDIDEEELDVEVTRERTRNDSVETKLIANIPVKRVKNLGRNR